MEIQIVSGAIFYMDFSFRFFRSLSQAVSMIRNIESCCFVKFLADIFQSVALSAATASNY